MAEWLALEGDVMLRLVLALLYGGALGLEREAHGRAAGLRTLILVCLGSTLITIVSITLPADVSPDMAAIIRMDPGRIAAGIVTGVGFLGGAAVIKLGDLVRGVTTAASIWFAAALGIALGQGHYSLATWATLVAVVVLWLLPYVGRVISSPIYRRVALTVSEASEGQAKVTEVFDAHAIRIMDVNASHNGGHGPTQLLFYVRGRQALQGPRVVAALAALDGVSAVRWD